MTISSVATPTLAAMTLLELEQLPCGCVASIYQMGPAELELEFVEAKGPHCVFGDHRAGDISRLGLPDDLVVTDGATGA